jgi:fructokinase
MGLMILPGGDGSPPKHAMTQWSAARHGTIPMDGVGRTDARGDPARFCARQTSPAATFHFNRADVREAWKEDGMIVVCGEALVDMVPSKCGAEDGYVPRPGGSPSNVAVGLARLEVPVAFLGKVSGDPFGRLLRRHLETNAVDLRYVVTGTEHTTLAFVARREGEEEEYSFYAENSADRNLRPQDLPATFAPGVGGIHFGSISLVLEPGAATLEACMQRERGRLLISLDPNVRPFLIEDAAAYRARLEGWVATADFIKVSAADLGWLYPGVPVDRMAREWLELGPVLVVVTRGSQGSSAHGRRAEASAAPIAVKVVDTVGAGDSFTSGALGWLHRTGRLDRTILAELSEVELGELLGYAGLVSAFTCTRAGADPPSVAELAAFAKSRA